MACWVQGASGASQTGPNLSLSSLGGQLGHQSGGRGQQISVQNYNGMEPAVPWLRPINARSDMTQVVARPGPLNMQHLMSTDSKPGITSASANSSNSHVNEWCSKLGTYIHMYIFICLDFGTRVSVS